MTCAKVFVKCTIVSTSGECFVGTNDCQCPQVSCPRLPGEGYDKCITVCQQKGHAEVMALIAAGGFARGATAYVEHKRVCDDCMLRLRAAGVVKIVLGNPPKDCH